MTDNHRFASLKGAARDWLAPDDYEWDDEQERHEVRTNDGSPNEDSEHGGVDPIMARRKPLARLGDLIST